MQLCSPPVWRALWHVYEVWYSGPSAQGMVVQAGCCLSATLSRECASPLRCCCCSLPTRCLPTCPAPYCLAFLPFSEAKELCPQLIVVPFMFEQYEATSEKVWPAWQRWRRCGEQRWWLEVCLSCPAMECAWWSSTSRQQRRPPGLPGWPHPPTHPPTSNQATLHSPTHPSEQVFRILLRYTSAIQPLSCDEAYLDVTCALGALWLVEVARLHGICAAPVQLKWRRVAALCFRSRLPPPALPTCAGCSIPKRT